MTQRSRVEVACFTHVRYKLVECQLLVKSDTKAFDSWRWLNADIRNRNVFHINLTSSPSNSELDDFGFLIVQLEAVAKQPGMHTGSAPFKTIDLHRKLIFWHGNVDLRIICILVVRQTE